ncbi:MAG: sensor histidine kinase [Candidatus Saccharicenans sp.]|nr:MAG: ATP-binding protein [Candidatus Aminicenantes bacterium]HEK85005.1 HAMP domain-containing histidine kinase [Candidatus Aminicenantes bacterium]
MKRKEFWIFFIIPYVVTVGLFITVSQLNRNFIQVRVESLIQDQLKATASILKTQIKEMLEEGIPAGQVLDRYSGIEDIYFIALLDRQENVLDWRSQFEGYLPFSRYKRPPTEFWIIDSPQGPIFNHYSFFTLKDGTLYHLYLGYSMKNLALLNDYYRRNFWLMIGILTIAGLAIWAGVFRLYSHYLRAVEETIKQAQEKERFREISGFTAGVAHEVKNPLNSLALLFEFLEKKAPPDSVSLIRSGKQEVQKIATIIDRFSEAIKPLQLQQEKISLAELVKEEILNLGREIKEKEVKLELEVPSSIFLVGDRLLLGRVINNLLKNALEVSTQGQGIKIKAILKKKNLVFSIEDEGPGVQIEKAEDIFEPFITSKKTGLGVGLYLARKIVEAHSGKIYFKNKPSGGTIFTIEIPGGFYE